MERPDSADAPRRPPGALDMALQFPVTTGLLVLIGAFFVLEWVAGGFSDMRVLLRLGANYRPLVLDGQVWRLVTAALLHAGFLHLAMNGWALWQLGRLSELTLGPALTLFVFVLTAITGSALSLAGGGVSVGASGAIFGVEGALVAFFVRHRERLTPAGKALLKQLLGWSGVMVVLGFVVPGIDWLGHLGGFAGGFLAGLPVRAIPPDARRGKVTVVLAAVAALVLVASIGGLFAWGGLAILGKPPRAIR